MGIPANYDADLQMMKVPPKQLDDISIEHLRFLRWTMQERGDHEDGWVVGEETGPIIDFLAEKAKREAEESVAA